MNDKYAQLPEPEPGGRLEETKRIARILELILLIGNEPRRWTRKALSERLVVSDRQLDKDFALIRNRLHFGLEHSREGYYFSRVPLVQVVQYTAAEALALLTALQVARSTGAIDPAGLATAIARTEAALPAPFATVVRDVRRVGDVTAPRHLHRAQVAQRVAQAMLEKRCLRVEYETASRGGQRSVRILRPYAMQPRDHGWLLVAHDSVRGEVRDFTVDRIVRSELLDERYEIPADFDIGAYRGTGWGVLRGMAGEPVDVVLRFTPDEGRRVRDQVHHVSQREEIQPDGTVVIAFHVGITSELARWVFQWGTGCEVLAPRELRAMVRAQAERIAAMHEGDVG